jgi:DnaJ-class molecular chaperone
MKIPYKCPNCDGLGKRNVKCESGLGIVDVAMVCNACEGKGIIWNESFNKKE